MVKDLMRKPDELKQRSSVVEQRPHKATTSGPNPLAATNPYEILDGVLLSDGSLKRSGRYLSRKSLAYFSIAQAKGVLHLDWELEILDALTSLGIEPCNGYPKVSGRHEDLYLITKISPLLEVQYHRWYERGEKGIPDNIALTPIVLANWFMGDGCVYQYKSGKRYLTLSTDGFREHEVLRLKDMLSDIGLAGFNMYRHANCIPIHGFYLGIGQSQLVDRFLDNIAPYVLPSFSYKMKRGKVATGSTPVAAI